ncbi:MAG: hypothetical protein IMW89_03850 [Ktedonobacteraceae bacterium]|nr:hypothetical protein [Ktedonobacteraceae bacterium]
MMSQRETGEPAQEQISPAYGSYEGSQEYPRQQEEISYQPPLEAASASYEQPLREGTAGKVYSPSFNKTLIHLLWFVVAMVALAVFAVICLIFVGGTAGWISFCAAGFVIMVIVATALGTASPEKAK